MKKIYILMIALFISGIAKAQIPILTQYNTVPVAGDTLILSSNNNDTIMPGLSGANIFWDFSNFNYTISFFQNLSSGSIIYDMTPSSFYYYLYPNATLLSNWPVLFSYNFENKYYQSNNLAYYYLGRIVHVDVGNANFGTKLLNPELIMKFPFTYLSSAKDTIISKGGYTINSSQIFHNVEDSINRTIQADGWGNINIFGNLHTNVLRIKKLDSVLRIEYNSANNIPGFNDTIKTIKKYVNCYYEWYDGINRQYLMKISGTQDSSQIFHPESFYITNAGIPSLSFSTYNSISENKNLKITLSPNPATNSLTLNLTQLKNLQNTTVSIYDIQGQQLLQQNILQPQTELDISGFAKGIYIIKLINEKETLQSKFIKE